MAKPSVTHNSWAGMIQRCTDPNYAKFKYYGGRGIKVCDRWRHSFAAFLEDMGERPPGGTLERKDHNGDYCPENCCWATWTEQQNNRSNSRLLTFRDKTQTVAQWSRELGTPYQTIIDRLRLGWTTERALGTPHQKRWQRGFSAHRMLTVRGMTLSMADWSRRTGLFESTICGRLRRGWDVERAVLTPTSASRANANAHASQGVA